MFWERYEFLSVISVNISTWHLLCWLEWRCSYTYHMIFGGEKCIFVCEHQHNDCNVSLRGMGAYHSELNSTFKIEIRMVHAEGISVESRTNWFGEKKTTSFNFSGNPNTKNHIVINFCIYMFLTVQMCNFVSDIWKSFELFIFPTIFLFHCCFRDFKCKYLEDYYINAHG